MPDLRARASRRAATLASRSPRALALRRSRVSLSAIRLARNDAVVCEGVLGPGIRLAFVPLLANAVAVVVAVVVAVAVAVVLYSFICVFA